VEVYKASWKLQNKFEGRRGNGTIEFQFFCQQLLEICRVLPIMWQHSTKVSRNLNKLLFSYISFTTAIVLLYLHCNAALQVAMAMSLRN